MYESLDDWPTKIISEDIVYHRTEIGTCSTSEKYHEKVHISSFDQGTCWYHGNFRWKGYKTRLDRHHRKYADISEVREKSKNCICNLQKHKRLGLTLSE